MSMREKYKREHADESSEEEEEEEVYDEDRVVEVVTNWIEKKRNPDLEFVSVEGRSINLKLEGKPFSINCDDIWMIENISSEDESLDAYMGIANSIFFGSQMNLKVFLKEFGSLLPGGYIFFKVLILVLMIPLIVVKT